MLRALTADERQAPQDAHLALPLRNFAELQARIAHGQVLTLAEMQARYFPRAEDWRAVAAWARDHGYRTEAEDQTHLTVFAHSTIANIEQTLGTTFARVRGADGRESTSAVTPPRLPRAIAGLVRGVGHLTPGLRPRPRQSAAPVIIAAQGDTFLSPQTVAQFYHASGLGLDGTGQTIVVVGTAQVNPSDLTAFWTTCGVATTIDQFTEIDPYPANLDPNSDASDPTCDIEWCSAMAPKAKVLYISTTEVDTYANLLLNRLGSDASIHQVTESEGLAEVSYLQAGVAPADTEYFAALAAVGITCFASSGDEGTNQDFVNGSNVGTGSYDPNGLLTVDYPASDPFVVAVGGTALGYNDGAGGFALPVTEGGWCLPDPPLSVIAGEPPNYSFAASTGGLSQVFARPAWQVGVGLPGGGMRSVPDVAAPASTFPVAYSTFANGTALGFGGTSMSSPIWAGFCALLNQARAQSNLTPVGLLGPLLYPLLGTSAFHSLAEGSNNGQSFTAGSTNGAYGLAPNYNLVTGLGSPDVGALVAALSVATPPTGPSIYIQPTDQSAGLGLSATFSVAALGSAPLQYQWYKNGVAIPGATNYNYTLSGVGSADVATYSVTVSNAVGSVVSTLATLTLGSAPVLVLQPASASVALGGSVTFTIRATSGGTLLYQWYSLAPEFGSTHIVPGANGPSLTLDGVDAAEAGDYYASVSNVYGTAESSFAQLSIGPPGGGAPSRIVDLSARANVGGGGNILIAGFVIQGVGSKNILLRGIGPTLGGSPYDVPGALAEVALTAFDSTGTAVAADTGWGGDAGLTADFAAVGAFALAPNSADSALASYLPVGAYTSQVAGVGTGTGVALAEIYDLDGPSASTSLVNISARADVTTGANILIAGFVIQGTQPVTLLLRGIGPTLGGAPFNLSNYLPRTSVQLFDSTGTLMATNTDWGTTPLPGPSAAGGSFRAATAGDMANVGAFLLPTGSHDSAMVATLGPGSFTLQLSGTDSLTGIGLVEVYLLP